MRLSPDGKRLALRATSTAPTQSEKPNKAKGKPADTSSISLVVLDAESKGVQRKLPIPPKNTLEWFRWAGNDKLLLSVSQVGVVYDAEVRFTRLLLIDLTTGDLSVVGRREMGIIGDDVLLVDPAGRFVLVSLQRSIFEYPAVYRFPLDGTAAKNGVLVQPPKDQVWNWYADTSGVVRMGFEYSGGGKLKVWYRANASENLKTIARLTEDGPEDDVWDVLQIVSGSDEGYVLKPDDSGRVALRKFNYATRTAGETVVAAPGWDISDVSFDDDNKPLAAYYTDDRERVIWLNPAMKRLQARLDKALPNTDVWITSRAKDDSRMIVLASHEDDPGAYYIYDATKGSLDLFYAEKAAIDPSELATPRPIQFSARDKTTIHGYLTLPRGRSGKNLPLIILPHGGPYGVRDRLQFDSEVQFLANRGYAVLQPNYRGSDGYGDSFDELGRGQIGRAMQDDLDDAMDWAVAQGIADRNRICVVGSSYGGYAALWAVTRNPERYRCAASFAGVTDLKRQLKYDANFFSKKGARKWRERVLGQDAEFDLALVSPAQQVARLTRPVLLAHGDADTNVPFAQFKAMRDAASKAGIPIETLIFKDEGHGFDLPADEARWYETLEAFLAKHNPADPIAETTAPQPPIPPSGTPPKP